MKKYLALIFVLFLFGCEETILLDLDQTQPKLVIEGLLTNRPGDQFVKVTRSVGFYATGGAEKISNASVKVVDSDGQEFLYTEAFPGYYIPVDNFSGVVGKRYRLSVQVGASQFESEDELLRVAEVDSIGYTLSSDPSEDQIDSGDLYELLLYFKEPKDTEDYYLFKFYRNDTLTYTNSNDIYLISDEALSESIIGFPGPVYYAEQDTARMDMFSVTRDGYLYYSDLTNLLFSDGGLFGPVPANPRGNISNGALGFFQVSAVTESEIIVKKK